MDKSLLEDLSYGAIVLPFVTARADGVTDGDGIIAPMPIRLYGIDAPEWNQSYGRTARQALARHIMGRGLYVTPLEVDRFGRIVARVYVTRDEKDVGQWMVRAGHAWSVVKEYDAAMAEARAVPRGLWCDSSAVNPLTWRKQHPEYFK